MPQVGRAYVGSGNHDVLKNPKVRVIADDARHFLLTTTETFDAITSDPLDPWVKGAATLYTKEFFDVARQHLNPGGVMTLYVQLFESSPAAVKSEVATFFESFPEAGIYGAADLFGNDAGRARDLKGWLADAQVNRDRDLRLQYLAGLGLNEHSGDEIYRELLDYRTYPDDILVATEGTVDDLKAAMSGVRE